MPWPPHNSPYAFAENRLIDGIELEGLEWEPTKDKKGAITGYNWCGYNSDGSPVKGSVSGGLVEKEHYSTGRGKISSVFVYSSNAKDQSGRLDVINFGKPSEPGRSSEVYDATYDYDYTIRFKHASGGKSGYGYDVTAQLSRFGESSQEFKFDGFRGGISSGSYGDDYAIRNAGRSVGLAGQSPAAIPVYLETFIMPLPKFGLIGKTGSFLFGKSAGRIFWSGGREAMSTAEQFALSTGGRTLEMTNAGKILTWVTEKTSFTMTKPFWKMASRSFAKGASGEVDVFLNFKFLRSNSIFYKIERPILESRGVFLKFHTK